jgi:hypothetical protein
MDYMSTASSTQPAGATAGIENDRQIQETRSQSKLVFDIGPRTTDQDSRL